MGRSTKKGPFVDEKLLKKIKTMQKSGEKKVINIVIIPLPILLFPPPLRPLRKYFVHLADVMMMEADMDAKVTAAGLTAPAAGTMTYDQLGQLEAIFANGGSADDQKAAAMKVLTVG